MCNEMSDIGKLLAGQSNLATEIIVKRRDGAIASLQKFGNTFLKLKALLAWLLALGSLALAHMTHSHVDSIWNGLMDCSWEYKVS